MSTDSTLIAGIWGDFRKGSNPPSLPADSTFLRTFESWGVRNTPWFPCDSRVDLQTPGSDVLRAWAQVELGDDDKALRDDLPLRALLRAIWDALELYGSLTLRRADVSIPTGRAGAALRLRVTTAEVRPRDEVLPRELALVDFASVPESRDDKQWDPPSIIAAMRSFTGSEAAPSDAPERTNHAQAIEHPFVVRSHAFAATIRLRDWTIDDAGWGLEVAAYACNDTGVEGDVLLSIRGINQRFEEIG